MYKRLACNGIEVPYFGYARAVPTSNEGLNMAEMVGNLKEREGYWTPPVEASHGEAARRPVELCVKCGTEFIIGSRFCYVCGNGRTSGTRSSMRAEWLKFVNLRTLSDAMGLPIASTIAFGIGIICAICAVATGLIYSASNALEFEAIQAYRLEWLLAAAAMFLAAILLKRPE